MLDKTNTASPISADTAYRSKATGNGFSSRVHFRQTRGADVTPSRAEANAARSEVPPLSSPFFAAQKHRFGLFVRAIGAASAKTKIGLANIVTKAGGSRDVELRTTGRSAT